MLKDSKISLQRGDNKQTKEEGPFQVSLFQA